jgi:DNA-binding transcriptional regulator YhcF (GntR family)
MIRDREPLKLRPESLIELSNLMLAQEDELPPKLVSELKSFQKGNMVVRPLNIDDWENDPRRYIRLAASIVADIIRGDLSPGDKVPSRVSLARKYGVSKPTASKAVRLLAGIGAAELDGNAYRVSNRIPVPVMKEKTRTP